jgi:hypothetical protein
VYDFISSASDAKFQYKSMQKPVQTVIVCIIIIKCKTSVYNIQYNVRFDYRHVSVYIIYDNKWRFSKQLDCIPS